MNWAERLRGDDLRDPNIQILFCVFATIRAGHCPCTGKKGYYLGWAGF